MRGKRVKMVEKKEYKVTQLQANWASDKKYYDDQRRRAILKLNSIDAYGYSQFKRKQNMYDNYVYDLQTDLRNMDFREVGEADGWYAKKTKNAVESFQLAALTTERAIDGTPTSISNVTFNDKIDGVVGNKTKAEIKIWLKKNYANPVEIHYPVLLIAQKYNMSCWAASFQMILAYNGIKWTQEEVCDNAGLPRAKLTSGDSTADAIQEASNLGFRLIEHPRASLPVSEWVKLLKEKGPLMVTWSGPHAVVLKGITKDPNDPIVFINNPEPVNVGNDQMTSLLNFHTELSTQQNWYVYYFEEPASRDISVNGIEKFPS